jgi:hypothetical protein
MVIRARIISFRTMMKGFDPVSAQMHGARAMLMRDAGPSGVSRGGERQYQQRRKEKGEASHPARLAHFEGIGPADDPARKEKGAAVAAWFLSN